MGYSIIMRLSMNYWETTNRFWCYTYIFLGLQIFVEVTLISQLYVVIKQHFVVESKKVNSVLNEDA